MCTFIGFKQSVGRFVWGGRNGMGCFVRGGKNGMGCFVWGDKNCMGCFVRGGKSMRNVLSGVTKNGMGCFVLHSGAPAQPLKISNTLLSKRFCNNTCPMDIVVLKYEVRFLMCLEMWIHTIGSRISSM